MDGIFYFAEACRRDPEVDAWLARQPPGLGPLAALWFNALRECGADVKELMHDGRPTACVQDAAFAYVGAFRAHVNIGFFRGAHLADPAGLLEGAGKAMRHVKLRPDVDIDTDSLQALIETAYCDMQARREE